MLIWTASLASEDHCSEVAMMSSCRVQGCDKFERKRGLRGGTVADDCDYTRVNFCEKNKKRVPRVSRQSWQNLQSGRNGRRIWQSLPPLSAPESLLFLGS